MNITGSLVQLPTWEDYYYAPEEDEDVSNNFETQDMANSHIAKAVHASSPVKQLSSDNRAEKIFLTAMKSSAIRALYETAVNSPSDTLPSGPWSIIVTEDIPSEYNAECHFSNREIHIRSNISDDEALTLLVFELINAISFPKFTAIWRKTDQGQTECEDYVKEIERIEFEGTLIHHKMITEAIKEMNWSDKLDIYGGNALLDFETRWSVIKFSTHANRYRDSWSLRTGKKAVYPEP